jgi:signal transduction histidine kinase/CheY-like chemotaxis protein
MTWAALTSIIALSAVFVHVFVSAMNDARRDAAEKSSALEEEMLRREKAEAALRRAEKLEALGRLTGGIAHDFNNILTVLLAESQMLEEHAVAGRPLGAEELEQIAELRRSSERAAALTGQLLSFSRQRVGTPEIIDLNAALRRLQPLLKRVIREEIRLDIDLPAKVGAVRMEVAQFDQVVMNLILNACDALPSRGQVTVHTATVDCDETWLATHPDARLGPHVMLSVSDTGSGIGAEHIDQIFDPFFTTKDQSLRPGTGLGLASVHGIVTAAGGHITVESEEGSGTRFCVYLPRAAEDSLPERLTDAPAPPRPEKRSILLCEDDSAVRRVLLHMLDRSEFDVYEAETPEAALELARTHDGPIDLLLSDVIMPGMNGRELAEAIREIYPRIAILLVSGYASSSLDLEKLGSRVGFLSKPFTQDDLMTRIHDLFRDATTD